MLAKPLVSNCVISYFEVSILIMLEDAREEISGREENSPCLMFQS